MKGKRFHDSKVMFKEVCKSAEEFPAAVDIFLVEDFEPMRCLIASVLRDRPGFRIVGEAAHGPAAIQKVKELRPNLVLLDIGPPSLNGIEVARQMRELNPSPRIVFLSQESSPEIMRLAHEAGASGYVVKSELVRLRQCAPYYEAKRTSVVSLVKTGLFRELAG